VDRTGKRKDLAKPRFIGGFAWSGPDEIWFASVAGGDSEIRGVTLSGRQRLLASMPGEFLLHDVFRDGRVLLERDSESWETVGASPGQARERSLSWLDKSVVADLSADGGTLLFSEVGAGAGAQSAVYLRKTDGSPAIRLGDGAAMAMSPDGRWGLAKLSDSEMALVPTGAGRPRSLSSGRIRLERAGAFFPEGRRILLAGSEAGHDVRLYVQDVDGGEPRAITSESTRISWPGNPISPDGKWVAALNADGIISLYSVDGGATVPPRPIPGGVRGTVLRWSADGRSVFIREGSDLRVASVDRVDPWSGHKELWKKFMPTEPLGSGVVFAMVMAPDGKSWAYTYNRYFSDLFLVEGLK
jgi:hypothetical protein